MASKRVNAVNIKGSFELDTMEITEQTKEAEFTYDFLQILKDFDGRTITISIKEENELPVKEEE
jgi:hypothetical protein